MAKSKVNIQPLGKRILVKPQEVEKTTPGGLVIPPSAQEGEKPVMGVVVKLGTGEKDFKFTVKEGDTVYFKKYAPDEFEAEGETYFVLSEEDILAVVG